MDGSPGVAMNFVRDARHGLRLLLKSPGFTLMAVLALSVGVGSNITIFGFVNAVLLRPVDAVEPERLIRAYANGADPVALISYDDYLEYRDRNQSLASLALFHWGGIRAVRVNGSTEMIHVMPVTGNYFEALGVRATLGRAIAERDDDPAAGGVVVLSDEGWRHHFSADPNVLGQTIFISKQAFVIVGVAPQWFRGAIGAPVVPQMYVAWNSPLGRFPGGHLIGRLKPGVSRGEAQADLSRIATQLTAEKHRDIGISVYTARSMAPAFAETLEWFAALFLVVVAVVLLIACDNVGMLLMARSASRRREFAIRLALGASRGQLFGQLFTECLLLAALGGLGAAEVAYVTSRLLTQIYLPVPMPIALPFVFDARVVLFAVLISVATTALFGLGPAMQSLNTDVATCLKQAGATDGRSRVRAGMVITQVTFSTALLVTAAVLVRSATSAGATARGFSTEHVLMGTVNLSTAGYSPVQGALFYQRLQERVEAIPGVLSANMVDVIPVATNRPVAPIEIKADNGKTTGNVESERVYANSVSPGHFRTLGIPLLRGRDFAISDDPAATPVCVVNETLAQRFWPGENAIGRHLQIADGGWIEVVGVAQDSKYLSLEEFRTAFLYRPLAQSYAGTATVLVKTMGGGAVAEALRRQVELLDPNVGAYNIQPLEDRMSLTVAPNRAAGLVATILGLVGLGLGLIGTQGIMSLTVEQRRREIGVRMALGATPRSVVRLITSQGMRWTAAGLALGAAAAFAAALALRKLMIGISPADPFSFLGVGALLAGVAYLACYIPARKASRIDPLSVLREE
jgi:putative ABC transport system permease protein